MRDASSAGADREVQVSAHRLPLDLPPCAPSQGNCLLALFPNKGAFLSEQTACGHAQLCLPLAPKDQCGWPLQEPPVLNHVEGGETERLSVQSGPRCKAWSWRQM